MLYESMNEVDSLFQLKLISFILLSVSILWRQWAHSYAYIMGGGDSHGADDVVNVDASVETFDDDPMALYLSYFDVWGIDASDAYFVGLIDNLLLYKHSWLYFNANILYMACVACNTFG
jgi:hypothetical protein